MRPSLLAILATTTAIFVSGCDGSNTPASNVSNSGTFAPVSTASKDAPAGTTVIGDPKWSFDPAAAPNANPGTSLAGIAETKWSFDPAAAPDANPGTSLTGTVDKKWSFDPAPAPGKNPGMNLAGTAEKKWSFDPAAAPDANPGTSLAGTAEKNWSFDPAAAPGKNPGVNLAGTAEKKWSFDSAAAPDANPGASLAGAAEKKWSFDPAAAPDANPGASLAGAAEKKWSFDPAAAPDANPGTSLAGTAETKWSFDPAAAPDANPGTSPAGVPEAVLKKAAVAAVDAALGLAKATDQAAKDALNIAKQNAANAQTAADTAAGNLAKATTDPAFIDADQTAKAAKVAADEALAIATADAARAATALAAIQTAANNAAIAPSAQEAQAAVDAAMGAAKAAEVAAANAAVDAANAAAQTVMDTKAKTAAAVEVTAAAAKAAATDLVNAPTDPVLQATAKAAQDALAAANEALKTATDNAANAKAAAAAAKMAADNAANAPSAEAAKAAADAAKTAATAAQTLAKSTPTLLAQAQASAAQAGKAIRAPSVTSYDKSRFGMMITWGIFSATGKSEWAINNPPYNVGTQAGLDLYNSFASQFLPNATNVASMVKLAKDTGMGYIVLSVQNMDGYSLWDTKADEFSKGYNSNTFGPHQDVLKLFADECKKQGVRFVLLYSLINQLNLDYPGSGFTLYSERKGDWVKYRAFLNKQMTELFTNYGDMAQIWFAGGWAKKQSDWEFGTLYSTIRKAQPKVLIGTENGTGDPEMKDPDDFTIHELPVLAPDVVNTPGEIVATSMLPDLADCCGGNRWGYTDTQGIQKREWIFQLLLTTISNGKNFVLNIGPRGDGTLPDDVGIEFGAVGKWVKDNAEAIYGTKAGIPGFDSTQGTGADGNHYVYLFIRDQNQKTIDLPTAFVDVTSATPLVTGGATLPPEVKITKNVTTGMTTLDFSAVSRTAREPLTLKLVADTHDNVYAFGTATASNIFANARIYAPSMAADSDPTSRWATDDLTKSATLTQTYAKPVKIKGIQMAEGGFAGRTTSYTIEANIGGKWTQIASGTETPSLPGKPSIPAIGASKFIVLDTPVVASAMRFTANSQTFGPSLYTVLAIVDGTYK